MGTKLIKRVQVVQEYLLVGEANSSHKSYWDRDFNEKRRIPVGQSTITEIHPIREMSDAEVALFGAGQEEG